MVNTMKSYRLFFKYFSGVLSLIVVSSCLDPIEITGVEATEDRVFINSQLDAGATSQLLTMAQVTPFGTFDFDVLSGAEVTLFEDDLVIGSYEEQNPGVYRLENPNGIGETGKSYHVEIALPNGKQIVSRPDRIPEIIPIDSASFNFPNNRSIDISVFTDIPDFNGYIRWTYDELYIFPEVFCGFLDPTNVCYVIPFSNNQNIELLDLTNFNADRIEDYVIHTELDLDPIEYTTRHYFNVYQRSISEQAFNYWRSVEGVTELGGTVFDVPPAPVQGNFYNPEDSTEIVLGYFEAASVDTARTFILGETFRRRTSSNRVCSAFGAGPIPCCNCLSIRGASLDRPFWIE